MAFIIMKILWNLEESLLKRVILFCVDKYLFVKTEQNGILCRFTCFVSV